MLGDTVTLVRASMAVMYMKEQVPTLCYGSIYSYVRSNYGSNQGTGGGVMAALGLLEGMLGFGNVEKSCIALHAAQDSFGTATNVTGDGL
ncbi:MAG: hypothetical protein ACLS8D_12070 [Clostridioides difficile]